MDPDKTLAEIRKELIELRLAQDMENSSAAFDAATNIADLVEDLDEWLAKGGFLPARWQKGRAS